MKNSTTRVPKLKKLEKAPHAIDFVGTGTFQVAQQDILQLRSVELIKTVESNLSARGLHHRSFDYFSKDVKASSAEIQRTVLQGVRDPKAKNSNHYLKNEYFQRALGFERIGQIDKAIDDYGRCVAMDGKCAAAYFNRGGLYSTQGKLEQAIADLSKAVSIQPSNLVYLTNRSLLYRRKGMFEEATADMVLMKSLEADSNRPDTKKSANSQPNSGRKNLSTISRSSSRAFMSPKGGDADGYSPLTRRPSMLRRAPSSSRNLRSGRSFRSRAESDDDDANDPTMEYVAPPPKSSDPMINYLKKSYIEREEATVELRSVIDFLKSVKFFSGIASDPVVMKNVADKVKLCTYAKGDYIFQEGDPGKSFYIVADGEISVVKCILNGTYSLSVYMLEINVILYCYPCYRTW